MFHFLDLLNWWHEKGTEERKKKVVTFFTLQNSSSGRKFRKNMWGQKATKIHTKKKIGRERRVGFLLLAHKVLMEWWFIIKNEAAVREWDSVEKKFLVLDRSSFFLVDPWGEFLNFLSYRMSLLIFWMIGWFHGVRSKLCRIFLSIES